MLLFFSYLHYRYYWFLVIKTTNSRLIVDDIALERKYVFRKRSFLYNTHGQKMNYILV